MQREEVIKRLGEHRAELKQMGVKSLGLFGSVARDEGASDSDVDVLVEFDRPIGLFGLLRVQYRLEGILGCSVDVGTPGSLRARIRERVLGEAVYVTWCRFRSHSFVTMETIPRPVVYGG